MNILICVAASRFFCITSFKLTYNVSAVLWLRLVVNKLNVLIYTLMSHSICGIVDIQMIHVYIHVGYSYA